MMMNVYSCEKQTRRVHNHFVPGFSAFLKPGFRITLIINRILNHQVIPKSLCGKMVVYEESSKYTFYESEILEMMETNIN